MPAPHSSRENGTLGGRPKGLTNLDRTVSKARKRVAMAKISLAERCQQIEIDGVDILERLFRDENQPGSVRLGAISQIHDRARGKPVAPQLVEGRMTIFTGVPSRDESDCDIVEYGPATAINMEKADCASATRQPQRQLIQRVDDMPTYDIPDPAPVSAPVSAAQAYLDAEAERLRQSRDADQDKALGLKVDWSR